jgi:hypothetical protein
MQNSYGNTLISTYLFDQSIFFLVPFIGKTALSGYPNKTIPNFSKESKVILREGKFPMTTPLV